MATWLTLQGLGIGPMTFFGLGPMALTVGHNAKQSRSRKVGPRPCQDVRDEDA